MSLFLGREVRRTKEMMRNTALGDVGNLQKPYSVSLKNNMIDLIL
jgi:hypothetical protein